MKGMPFGKIWIAVSVILFVLEGLGYWLINGTLQSSELMPWRAAPGAVALALFVLVAIIGGFAYSYVFLQGYRGRGAVEGVRFGLWLTLLASVTFNLALAAMLPLRVVATAEFIIVDLVSFVVAGLAAGAIAGTHTVEVREAAAGVQPASGRAAA
ncbi:MAG: hypothetical protein ACRD04_03085 [Terriglobales bacterium]